MSPGHAFTTTAFVPWFLEGVTALATGMESSFASIPFSPADLSKATQSYVYRMDDDLTMTGTMSCALTGHFARSTRLDVYDEEDAQREEIITDQIKSDFPQAEIDSVTYSGIQTLEEPLKIICRLSHPAVMAQAGRLMLKPFQYLSDVSNPFTAEDRLGNVLFKHAYTEHESAQFLLPEGYILEGVPPDTVYQSPVGRCGVHYTAFGNTLNIQRVFTLEGPFWFVENYAMVRELFQSRQEMSAAMVVLKKATTE